MERKDENFGLLVKKDWESGNVTDRETEENQRSRIGEKKKVKVH